jgi:hypothetical protein
MPQDNSKLKESILIWNYQEEEAIKIFKDVKDASHVLSSFNLIC